MSGGVDCAAAAQLALDAGDEVVAVTLELWSDPGTDGEKSCCSPQAVAGARALAHRMGIPHITLDLRDRFRAEVVDDVPRADTPPAARPTRAFAATARSASTHAGARRRRWAPRGSPPGTTRASPTTSTARSSAPAADPRKDQSYMLARLDPDAARAPGFPLGELTKDAVRALAREAGLPVADKRESQDLCFLAGLGGRAFLRSATAGRG